MAIADIAINIITKGAELAKRQVDNLGGSADKSGKNLGKLAKGAGVAGLAVGTVLAKALADATRNFIEFDDAMTQSLAIMQTTIDQQDRMAQKAREVAVTMAVTATESAESFFFLASAGLDAEQSISALPQVAKFAQAGMFDMATATDLATDAQSALGLTVDDAQDNLNNLTRVTDVLVKANTLANASVQQFSEALTNKAGSALKVTNKSIEEGVAVLSAFADRGVKGAEAGEKLNQLLRDVTRAVGKNSEEFAKNNIHVVDNEGNLKNLADVIEELDNGMNGLSDQQKAVLLDQLGLNRGVADAVKILSGASDSIRDFETDLKEAGGITEEVAEKQMDSLENQLGILESKFDDVGLMILEKYKPAFKEAIEITGAFLDVLVGRMPDIENFAKGIDFIVSALRFLNPALGSAPKLTEKLAEAQKKLETDKLVRDYNEFSEALRLGAIQANDKARNMHRLEVELAMNRDTLNEVNKEVEDFVDNSEDLTNELKNNQLGALMKMINAEEAYNDIFKENERLLKIREERVTDVADAEKKLEKARLQQSTAQEEANRLAEDGTELSNKEALAIARQQEKVQELTDVEDKSEIQKLELAVAQERLIELQNESTQVSRESIQAQQELLRAEEDVKRAEEDLIRERERLKEATQEYNEATAKTPANIIRITEAHNNLLEAISEVNAFDNLFLAFDQIAESSDTTISKVYDMITAIKNLETLQKGGGSSSSSSSSSGSNKTGTDGSITPDTVSPFAGTGTKAGDVSMSPIVNQVINQNIKVEGASADEQARRVAEITKRALRNGYQIN
ncbi:tape measure protein [uncultured Mediterranean phage uvMED]|nr:tape measure protein [uncultured Mediterranean phage uvMED]BAR14793.1 Phage tail tape measure protein [uncultured Mediterranean phage uvMED]